MSIADLSRKGASVDAAEFRCPHYVPLPGTKRCQSYQDGGTCARPDFFLCVEWEKRNRHRLPAIGSRADDVPVPSNAMSATGEPLALTPPTDLFGNPAPELAPPKDPPKPAPTPAIPCPTFGRNTDGDQETRPPLRGLTTEDIESFRQLNVEVCLRSDAFGEIWLVPRYTGTGRKELTPEHAATVMRVLSAFPGSRVTAFEKTPPRAPAKEGSPA